MNGKSPKLIFIPGSLKGRFPFKEEDASLWEKCPKLDAALSSVARSSDLSFEDAGSLKDAMDRKAEAYLRKAWDAGAANFEPAIASTCIARTLDLWLRQLKILLESDTPKEELDSLTVLNKTVAYIADASAEAIRFSARCTAIINQPSKKGYLVENMGRGCLFQGKVVLPTI